MSTTTASTASTCPTPAAWLTVATIGTPNSRRLAGSNDLGPWFASASRDLGETFLVQLWEVDGSDKLRLRATQVDSENGATIVAAANSLRGMVTGM